MAGTARPKPKRPWRAWVLVTLCVLAVPVLLGVAGLGTLWVLADHQATLPWFLRQVPGLQVSGLRGTLRSDRIEIDHLDWQLPAQAGHIEARQLVLQGWRVTVRPELLRKIPSGSAPPPLARLHIDQLSAQWLQFQTGKSGRAAAPTTLHSPLALRVDRLSLAELHLNDLPAAHAVSATLDIAADGGRVHRVSDLAAQWEGVDLNGSASVTSNAPLSTVLALSASSARSPLGQPWQATLSAQGPLARLQVQAHLTQHLAQHLPQHLAEQLAPLAKSKDAPGSPPSPPSAATATPPALDAQATVLPFAIWPLADLVLSTQALDLAALSPGWPEPARPVRCW